MATSIVTICGFLLLFTCPTAFSSQENLRKLAVANNDLALRLHRKLSTGSSENVFFSPLSISSAFGMLFYGTRGDTAKELRAVLGYDKADLSTDLVHSSFNRFLTESLTAGSSEYTLDVVNSVLVDKNLELVPTYKSSVQDLYQASVRDVDFLNDGVSVVNDINSWVKSKTHGKIDKLLDELSPSNVMVILNAVYFKGTWKTQFDPSDTFMWMFYNGGLESGEKRVLQMQTTHEFPFFEDDELQVVELPYKGESISMIVLLPIKRNGLAAVEQGLTVEKLSNLRKKLRSTEVEVMLPKFKIEYSRELSSEIQALGAKRIFSAGAADFSGLTPSKNVFVSEVVHKAVIEVSEEGSEAAGVTGLISNRFGSLNPTFHADHPFLFAIVDKRSDMLLFVGRVDNL